MKITMIGNGRPKQLVYGQCFQILRAPPTTCHLFWMIWTHPIGHISRELAGEVECWHDTNNLGCVWLLWSIHNQWIAFEISSACGPASPPSLILKTRVPVRSCYLFRVAEVLGGSGRDSASKRVAAKVQFLLSYRYHLSPNTSDRIVYGYIFCCNAKERSVSAAYLSNAWRAG